MTRKLYLDYLRIIATFTVVYFHVLANIPYSNSNYVKIMPVIIEFCVPIFFMISGVLFLNPDRNVNLKKHIIKIATILFAWGFIYDFIVTVVIQKNFHSPKLFYV